MFKALVRHNLILLLFALACVSLLVLLQRLIAQPIQQQQSAQQQAWLQQVLPGIYYDNDLLASCYLIPNPAPGSKPPQRLYLATHQGNLVARIVTSEAIGYAGPIQLLIGINLPGEILDVRVTHHQETPGLGDKIESRRSNWIKQFSGQPWSPSTAARWEIRKMGGDFDQLSGATITSRAIILRLYQSLNNLFQQPLDLQQLPRCGEAQ